jgi:uncharacterized membrane protein YbjE (DUF340 family)
MLPVFTVFTVLTILSVLTYVARVHCVHHVTHIDRVLDRVVHLYLFTIVPVTVQIYETISQVSICVCRFFQSGSSWFGEFSNICNLRSICLISNIA